MEKKTAGGSALILALVVGVFLLALFQNCSRHDEGLDPGSAYLLEIQREALGVLSRHCASCHAPHITEMNSVGDILNPEDLIFNNFIVPGEPQNSSLYLLAIDGLMPPEPGVQLTGLELEVLHNWIYALGRPWENESDAEEE